MTTENMFAYDNSKSNGSDSIVTMRRIMKLLSFFCLIAFFCPSFLVSCSGQTIEVSAMDAAFGMEYQGSAITEGNPIMLLCLIFPLIALVMLFITRINDVASAIVVAFTSIGNLIMWLVLNEQVKEAAESSYCTVKHTGWYTFNMISIIGLIILALIIILKSIMRKTEQE